MYLHSFTDAMALSIITVDFWDSVGVKRYNLPTRRDPEAPSMLPAFCVNLETLKLEV